MSHETPKPKRTAAFARRSSKHPQSAIVRQMTVIRKYAKEHGLEIVRAYSDVSNGGGKS
jgi:hypothetical protein